MDTLKHDICHYTLILHDFVASVTVLLDQLSYLWQVR